MDAHTRLAFIAAPLLVAGTVAGFLVTGDTLDETFDLSPAAQHDAAAPGDSCAVPGALAFPSEAETESFTGDVPADAAGGDVTVNAYHGGVEVVTWEEDGYSVTVAEVDENDRLEPEVDAGVADGAFSLDVDVVDTARQEAGPVSASVTTATAEAHVKVRVPDKAYRYVEADTTPEGNDSAEIQAHIGGPPDIQSDENASDHPALVEGVTADEVVVDSYNEPAGAVDVTADDLLVDSYNGLAATSDVVVAGNLTVDSYNGPACARSLEAGHLLVDSYNDPALASDLEADAIVVDSYNGAAIARDVQAADVEADSYNGKAKVSVIPVADGDVVADSYNGKATVLVPTGPTYGYEAEADTYNGEAEIALPNATVQEDDGEHSGGETAYAKTQGFDSRSIQVEVLADSYNADALVAER